MLNAKDGDFFVSDWLRNRNTMEFLGVWERIYNPNFNYGEFATIRNQAGLNNFKISVKEFVARTGAISLQAKAGRYGGTYAHKVIAFEFAMWISEGRALLAIASQMKKGRHWLGPCRVLMDCGYIPRSRYDLFCDLVFSVLPDHEHLPHEDELRRMAVDCFSKPFKTWSDERAPVHGQHYLGYYDAGVAMLQQLPENSQKLP